MIEAQPKTVLQEYEFDRLLNEVFKLEKQLPPGHPVRKALFDARCKVADALMMNRVGKSEAVESLPKGNTENTRP